MELTLTTTYWQEISMVLATALPIQTVSIGSKWRSCAWTTYIAAGANEPSTRFEAAKPFKGAQQLASATNIEEWAYEQYFTTRPGDPDVLVAPSGAASDRVAEVTSELVHVGATTVLVSHQRAPSAEIHLVCQRPWLRNSHQSSPTFHSACSCSTSSRSTTNGATTCEVTGQARALRQLPSHHQQRVGMRYRSGASQRCPCTRRDTEGKAVCCHR